MKQPWDEEDWKKAPGVLYKRGMTNAGLAPRDYSVQCRLWHAITVVQGYHIWWWSTHHQPHAWCETHSLKEKLDRIKEVTKDL